MAHKMVQKQIIFGTRHMPRDSPIGCAIVAHGLKGYKDFRVIRPIATGLGEAGLVAHAFNFSHSGMTANPNTFERPELFELDSWSTQLFDIECPILVVHGENDETIDVSNSESIAAAAASAG
jgi:pimeloyl-ACP methyl ester carboxylesterase